MSDVDKYNQILDEMIIKALNDAFVAGRSNQSFAVFKEEWTKENYSTCKECNCIVLNSFMVDNKTCYLCKR